MVIPATPDYNPHHYLAQNKVAAMLDLHIDQYSNKQYDQKK